MKKSELRQIIKEEIKRVLNENQSLGTYKIKINKMKEFDYNKYLAEGKLNEENYEEDYDTGGYVEAMHPDLFDHVNEIVRIFQEWERGPMTEPGMVGYAKDDLVDYITIKIRNA